MKNFWALFTGAFLGTLAFLFLATFFLGSPFEDWFNSAHAVVSEPQKIELSEQEKVLLWRMLNNGSLVSTDSIISNVTNFYGILIQALIGIIAVFGVLSFFAIRWQSEIKTEEFVSDRVEKRFASVEFNNKIQTLVSDWLDINTPETNLPLEVTERLDQIEAAIAELQPEDETDE